MSHKLKRVAIYCGSAVGKHPAYAEAAVDLVKALADQEIGIVYGGGNIGLMGVIGDAAITHGADIIGVMPRVLTNQEICHEGIPIELVDTMAQRKTRMEQLADAFIALPGGIGTLEELFEVITLQQLGEITGPIALYNIADFWTPLVQALHSITHAGFIPTKYLDALIVVDNPNDMFAALEQWQPPGVKWG